MPVVSLRGVSAGSELAQAIRAAVGDLAELQFTAAAPPAGLLWRQAVRGTALQWWGGGGAVVAARPADITVSLDGEPGHPVSGRLLMIADAAGRPLLQPFHALAACHRAPFLASLYLVEPDPARPPGRVMAGRVLAEAHRSSAVGYRALLGALGTAAAMLVRRALQAHPAPAPAFVPEPAPAGGAALLPGMLLASLLHWLGARIGGDMYGIALLADRPAALLHDGVLKPQTWITIPPAEGFVADPFFWPGRSDAVLCEAYAHRTGLGRLANFQIGTAPGAPVLRDVLATGHHLSYPFAWADGGRVLCLPEMASMRRQVLYELHDDGRMTPLCVVAENVAMADPTVMRVSGLLWIAYTDADMGAYDNLCLMFAERPEGPWTRHPGNPVKLDARSSRPGGTPFVVSGQLFRPAQDCSRTYGGALAINAVGVCTPTAYSETVVARLCPDPDGAFPDGVHTLAIDGDRVVIDGKRVSFHPNILLHKLLRRFRASGTPPTG